jgi:hypothetical protein
MSDVSSNRIKAFVARPAGFLLVMAMVFFAFDRLVGLGLGEVAESSHHRFARVYRGDHEPSILVLGHSRGVQIVSPDAVREVSGVPVYNLSANGMSTEIGEALLLDYAENGGKPKGIILEVSSICSNNGLIRDLKIFSNRSPRLSAILERDEPKLAAATRLFHTFRYNGDLMPRILFHCFGDDQGLTNFYVAKPEFLGETPISAADWQIQEGNPAAVARIVSWARERNIPVRLVVGPFWPAAEVDATVSERVIAALGEVTDEKVWDYSASLADHRFFADHVHLNADGTMELHRVMLESGFYGPWQGQGGQEKTE